MEANKILSADILDIVFDGRNKSYGAYDLRKTYNKRMVIALVTVASVLLLILLSYIIAQRLSPKEDKVAMIVQDVQLEEVKPEEKKEEPPPPPPPPKAEPPKIEMAKFTPPKIVKDEEVKEDEKPPEQEKLEDVKIALTNQEGIKDEGIVAPPVNDAGKGVVSAPTRVEEDWDKTFTKVEIESEYPGGQAAWARFLNKTFQYPSAASEAGIQGTIVVQFVVDKEGKVSDVQVISGPEELRAEALRVIKKSGKWIPAIQNGHQVKSYKKQPIVFKLDQ
ncbi:MAG TPA: TonB family protein [Chitinophagaceae bacterium]|nr:TonB family protein [Chitinophagaceae bacterium]